jgi:hypothetical protein
VLLRGRSSNATADCKSSSEDGLGDSRQKIAEVALDIGLAQLRERFGIEVKARAKRKLSKRR